MTEGNSSIRPQGASVPTEFRDLRSADKGPVRILCDEIGFPFDGRIEREDVLVAFARELLYDVSRENGLERQLAEMVGKTHNPDALEAINAAVEMLEADDKIAAAAHVHDVCRRLNPDDAYPTNHAIDQVSSIASVLRFGLEKPCRSRHAAEAANHVWKHLYGVSRFDRHTSPWEKDWARAKLTSAIISLLPALGASASQTQAGYEAKRSKPNNPSNREGM